GEGTARTDVDLALGFSLVWSGPGIRTFTATGDRPVQENEPTLFEIWVCADGYWCDHTKHVCPGELEPRYDELLDQLLAVYGRAGPRSSPPSRTTSGERPRLDRRDQPRRGDRRTGRLLRHDAPRRGAGGWRRTRPRAEARDRARARPAWDRADRGRFPARLGRRRARVQARPRGGAGRRDLGLLPGRAGRYRGACRAGGARERGGVAELGSQASGARGH